MLNKSNNNNTFSEITPAVQRHGPSCLSVMKTNGCYRRQGANTDQTALSTTLPLSAEFKERRWTRFIGAVNDDMKQKMLGRGGVGDGDNGIVDLKEVCPSRILEGLRRMWESARVEE